jgi:hypothetical protein
MTPLPEHLRKKRKKRKKHESGAGSLPSLSSHLSQGREALEVERRASQLDGGLDRFVARLRARLIAGAAVYRDASFQRPAPELVDEVQQELEDMCSWSFVLRFRLDQLRVRTGAAEEGGQHGNA